jgi:two-component system cell cycle sensor histidine kinase/response regulator CckA
MTTDLAGVPTVVSSDRTPSHTFLLVDDDPLLLEVLQEALESTGEVVLAAPSGFDALRLWSAHGGAVDLLITDIKMPGLDGRELARLCRERTPGLKVLFISGSEPVSIEIDDSTAFLRKPVFFDQLMEAVRSLVEPCAVTAPGTRGGRR